MRRAWASLAAPAVVVAVAAGCGSSKPPVQLEGDTNAAGGKALVLRATTKKRLALETGGLYALELRGIDADSANASFDKPEYVEQRCVSQPCEWTVVPAKAANYDFKAFLIDLQ
jgi:hypothetical protein